jgi:hypothetical protein
MAEALLRQRLQLLAYGTFMLPALTDGNLGNRRLFTR